MAVSTSGRHIASASVDRTVRLWANSPAGESQVLKVHTGAVRSVCFSRDDSLLLTASDDKTAKMWSVATLRFHGSFVGHSHWVYSAAFSKTTDLVATGSEDRSVRVWDVEKKSVIVNFHDVAGVGAAVSKVKFHPDGSFLAAAGTNGVVKLWDLRSRKLVQHYDAHAGPVEDMDFHPGGDHLATTCEAEALKLWDLREGRLLHQAAGGHQRPPLACAFGPSGRSLVTGGRDAIVIVWDCAAGGAPKEGPPVLRQASPAGKRPSSQRVSRTREPASQPLRSSEANSIATPLRPRRPGSASLPGRSIACRPSQAAEVPATQELGEHPSPEGPAVQPAEELPAPLAQTLQAMRQQLEIVARTVQLLDRRLAITEHQVTEMRQELLRGSRSGDATLLGHDAGNS